MSENNPYQVEVPDRAGQGDFGDLNTLDVGTRVMLVVHPWVLLASAVILTVGGIYCGIIAPIFMWNAKGFTHKSRIVTVILSALVGLGVPAGISYLMYHEMHNDWARMNSVERFNQVMYMLWHYADYWSWHSENAMPAYLFYYIYGSFTFNLILCSIFAAVARWDPTPTEIIQCSDRHAFIIVAHNSSGKLAKPIEAILKFAKPEQIFIADNGSTEAEIELTRALCRSLSTENSRINIAHLHYGNKTLAQYACIVELVRRYNDGSSPIDIVTLIDDDVFIPETFPSPSLERQFEDPSKIAIAYPLRVANYEASTYATLQDGEYYCGNIARFAQDLLGTQLFASGAIATWKIHPLQHVLERHCTAFNGEDLEMGYLLHKLCDKSTSKLDVQGAVRIGFERNCVVPTTVPVHVMHWYDVIPRPLRRRWAIKACQCGEHSFGVQRAQSWDPACHMYLWKFLKVIFSPRGTFYAPKMFIRVLCLWKVISLLREYLLVFGIVYSFIRLRTLDEFINLMVFYADSIAVSWSIGVLVCWTQSVSTARQGLALRPDIVFMYPVLLELPYGLIIRPISAMYTFCWYLWAERAPPSLRSQMRDDPEKAEVLLNAWSENSQV